MLTEDEWWATLPPERKRQVRRWLDPDSREKLLEEAARHPDQLPLPLLDDLPAEHSEDERG